MILIVLIFVQQVSSFCIGGGTIFGLQGPYVVDDYDSITKLDQLLQINNVQWLDFAV